MTLIEFIRKKFPLDVVEFEHAPWNFSVNGTTNDLDTEDAQFTVTLDIGKASKRQSLQFTLWVKDVEISRAIAKSKGER